VSLREDGHGKTERDTENVVGRWSGDWGEAAARQGIPSAHKPLKVSETQGRIPLQVSEGTWPC